MNTALKLPSGTLSSEHQAARQPGPQAPYLVYPAAIHLEGASHDQVNIFTGHIQQKSFHGHTYTITLNIHGVELQTFNIRPMLPVTDSEEVTGWLDPGYLYWLPEDKPQHK